MWPNPQFPCGFRHIYWRNPYGKHFFAVCNSHQQLPPEYDWLMKIDSKGYVNATSMKLNFWEIVFCFASISFYYMM